MASFWAQYNAQIDMVEAAAKHSIVLTFFHGKGGTISRVCTLHSTTNIDQLITYKGWKSSTFRSNHVASP